MAADATQVIKGKYVNIGYKEAKIRYAGAFLKA